jgi:RNA polymerase sigma-70 factor (ECF subfamily)
MPSTQLDPQVRAALLASIPHLRAFAISLTGDLDRADDLVQDAVVRGLSHLDRFEPGTNLQAWLFTILRNLFYSDHRKRRREVEDPDGAAAEKLSVAPAQGAHLDFQDLKTALARLSPEQREAILLVGAEGLTYEQAAEVCGVVVGTIKSRVNRARARLSELMALSPDDELGADRIVQAAVLAA